MILSATIITLNESKNISRCLDSLKGWVDEIIVVDSGSTDETVKIAKQFGAKVYFNIFENYAKQKNFALSKANGDWILSVDADEVIEKELAREIISTLENTCFSGYTIPRKNIIFGKLIRHTRWDPELDRHVWLWKKTDGKWVGDVHEEVEVGGEIGKLKYAKVHYQYETVREFIDMMNNYSELDARKIIRNGKHFNLINLFFQPIYNFLVRYFYRLGFVDGWRGFVLSYLMAVYHFILWIKIWTQENA